MDTGTGTCMIGAVTDVCCDAQKQVTVQCPPPVVGLVTPLPKR